MTNTVPNVPRELLADLLGNDHDKRIMAERHLLAMLANAPSPAGVDGLEVVAWLSSETVEAVIPGAGYELLLLEGRNLEPLCRLSDATAIIDGLRGELEAAGEILAQQGRRNTELRKMRDQKAQRIGELASHLEFAVTMLTVAGLAGNAQVESMRAALSAGKGGE